ncbi:MAG TPA: tetratricopeptide repeat protein, partial [Sphingomonadales bacterium]|nr:tetratricopeptide repeat protein [Sphingomonadales bacterium]
YATAWQWYGNIRGLMGGLEESERLLAKAREHDPLSAVITSNYVDALISSGKYREAERELAAALNLFPDFPLLYNATAQLAYLKRDWAKMREAMVKNLELQGLDAGILKAWVDMAEAYQKTGQKMPVPPPLLESVQALDFYQSGPDMIYLAGHKDLAFQEMKALLLLTGPRNLVFYGMWWPTYAAFRHDPAFKDAMREAGFVEIWRKHGWPDKCQPTANGDIECE